MVPPKMWPVLVTACEIVLLVGATLSHGGPGPMVPSVLTESDTLGARPGTPLYWVIPRPVWERRSWRTYSRTQMALRKVIHIQITPGKNLNRLGDRARSDRMQNRK